MSDIASPQGLATSTAAGAGLAARFSARERGLVLGIIIVVFLINLLTAVRSPTVWKDEVLFIDPAVNWVSGNGFVSTAWPGQSCRTFWTSNAPLHTMLLCPWLKLFGVSPTAARAVNFFYISLAAYLCWLAVARARWIKSPRNRIMLVLLILLGNGVSFAYRSGRYDSLAIVLLSGVCFLTTVRNSRVRTAGLIAAGVLVPFTGLQLLPFLGIMGVVLLAIGGWRTLRFTAPLGLGVMVGGGLFYGYLHAIGQWANFIKYTSGMQAVPHSEHVVPPGYYQRTLRMLADITEVRDYSLWGMAALLLLLTVVRLWMRVSAQQALPLRTLTLAFATVIFVPVGFAFAYTFAAYYTWMAFIPLSIMVLALWDPVTPAFRGGFATMVSGIQVAALAGIMAVGLPARLGLTAKEWIWRDYRRVETLAQRNVTRNDIALISPEAYYAVKRLARQTFVTSYEPQMTPQETASLTVLVLDSDEIPHITARLPGKWRQVAAMPPPPGASALHMRHLYQLTVLRREDPPRSSTQP